MSIVVPIREGVRLPDQFDTDTMTVEELDYFTAAPVRHVVVYRERQRLERIRRLHRFLTTHALAGDHAHACIRH